jgi:hypothetical protein
MALRDAPSCAALVIALLAALGIVAPRTASAQRRDAAAAEALFEEGRAALARGDLRVACARLEESLRLDPAPGTLLNLAECERKSGRLAQSWQHLRRALDVLEPGDERVAYAQRELRSIEPLVPKLTVRLAPGAPGGARVVRDGVELGQAALGVPLPIDPGPHVVVAAFAGSATRTYDMTIAAGESRELVVGPVAAAASPPPGAVVPRDAASPGGARRTISIVVIAAGAAGVVVGAITGALAIDRASTYRAHCSDGACDADGLDAASSGKTLSTMSTIGFLAGGALTLGGFVLLLTAPRAQVTVSIGVTRGGRVACSGAF